MSPLTSSSLSRRGFLKATGAVEQRSLTRDVTSTPAPFLAAAEHLDAKQKLQLTGLYLDDTASVTVNGVRVVPGQTVRFKAAKGRLLVSGSAAELGLRGSGSNTVTVTINGRTSNTVEF